MNETKSKRMNISDKRKTFLEDIRLSRCEHCDGTLIAKNVKY